MSRKHKFVWEDDYVFLERRESDYDRQHIGFTEVWYCRSMDSLCFIEGLRKKGGEIDGDKRCKGCSYS